jgi:mono/diheme cytochrome c family protein
MSSFLVATAALALALVAAGCGNKQSADLENGKRLYTGQLAKGEKANAGYQPCGSCHALSRANTKSTTGPNLDNAFVSAREDGMNDRTIQGVVEDQIAHPRRNSIMPAGIVSGDDARDVAAYVAEVAGVPGKDQGQLASIGTVQNTKPINEQNGTLTISADPTGALAFATTKANGTAGAIDIKMPNPSNVTHDIAIKGGPAGPRVGKGGTSEVKATLKAGTYELYCTVPGHEAGGMKATLTVK